MKTIKLLIPAILLSCGTQVRGQGIPDVLRGVEANNLSLQAARSSADAGKFESRMGNSLEDLSVEYEHVWGNPSPLGKNSELTVSQTFDFPTVYVQRSRLADNMARRYDNEYLAQRQQVLLEAKQLCIELQSLVRRERLIADRLEFDERLFARYSEMYESGDVSLLEKKRFSHEIILLRKAASEFAVRRVEIEKRLRTLNGGESPDFDPALPFQTEALAPLEEILRDYEAYAPQLLSYRLREEGAAHDLKLSRQQAIPKIDLGYKHEYGTADHDRFNGVTLGLSIPIFSNRHNVRRAQAVQTAAKLESRAASLEWESQLMEMYGKAEVMERSLADYDELSAPEEFFGMLTRMLNAGDISVMEYLSETYLYNDVMETRYRIEAEYRQLVARINMIYL